MPNISEVEYPKSSKRKRRSIVLHNGRKFCPSRYCKESWHGECKQKQDPLPNSNNYAWEWKTVTSPISSFCITRQGAGQTCERSGETRSLPNCWYDLGVMKVRDRLESFGKKEIPIFVHYASATMFCMPCCSEDRINDINVHNMYLIGKTVKQQQIFNANRNKNNIPSKLLELEYCLTCEVGI